MAFTDDISGWIRATASLHKSTVSDEFARDAGRAAETLVDGSGLRDAPAEVMRMFTRLIEVGYAQALRDVRDGEYDDGIGERPEPGTSPAPAVAPTENLFDGQARGVILQARDVNLRGATITTGSEAAGGRLIAVPAVHAPEPDAPFSYTSRHEDDGRLVIAPHADHLSLLRSGGPLSTDRYARLPWVRSFDWPTLDLTVVNNTREVAHFHEALFTIASSRTDPRPVPVILGSAKGPGLTLENLGWGPMDDCVLRFHLEHPREGTPRTAERTWPLNGDGRPTDRTPMDDALAEAGVNVAMVEKFRYNIGRAMRRALGPFTSGEIAVVGTLEFTQAEPDGSRSRRVHPYRGIIDFSLPPLDVPRPATAARHQVRLRADGDGYTVATQISQSLTPGQTGRFTVALGADRSSVHDLTIDLRYNGAERLDCGAVALELFRPRAE
ncbi:hypothetical protein OG417_47720 [Actinoallomurus sp. NBC_01490]|uniref:hypothetical protein n=1 Tax=Actinoallomurus sp. NBC_01490 TaxID=2903557 RepID=UPI002E381223|nr:hypothetical protein [Actinoallomurus sp. NBC_01490]